MNEEEKKLAEVGAKVMGWCKSTHGRTWIGKNGEYTGYMQPHTDFGVKWNPAQKIEQTMMVVKELLRQNPKWQFSFELDQKMCCALFLESAPEGFISHGSGDTPADQHALAMMLAIKNAVAEKL